MDKVNKMINGGYKDSDGDKVMDMIDCKPHNKNKQGWIHDVGSKIKDKAKEAYTEYKEDSKERYERKAELRTIEKEAYHEARKKEVVKFAQIRARQETERKINYRKEGGFVGQVRRGAENIRSSPSGLVTSNLNLFPPQKKSKKQKSKSNGNSIGSFDPYKNVPKIL